MSNHITEDIPRLLTGEANRDAVLSAAEHLRSCPDCQQELVSAVVAHASLTSAHRFAPEIVAPPSLDEHPDVAAAGTGTADAGPALPPLTSMFEKVRQEAEQATDRKQAAPKRLRLVAVAAAAVVLVGGGVTIAEVATSSSSSTTGRHTVSLTAFDRGRVRADVTIVGDRKVSIDATKLPRLDSNHVYELWLTDGARKNMQSVGLLGNDNTADFTVSPKSLTHYDNFEVSIQRTNQTQYSGVSVLRGQYKT
jgi:Anti-sigma-K factor rskA